MNNKIELARTLARTLHTPETWAHVERVAVKVKAMDGELYSHVEYINARGEWFPLNLVAYLHDLVEDTPVTLDTIENLFGRTVREAVDGITRRTNETYAEYIRRTMTNPISHAVKIADVGDHLNQENTIPSASLLPRYWRAWKTLHEKDVA